VDVLVQHAFYTCHDNLILIQEMLHTSVNNKTQTALIIDVFEQVH